jgi:tetratricopeptide (TPR) repeat protein
MRMAEEIPVDAQPNHPTTSGFLRRLDWSAFWTASLASFLVYCITLAPTVTLEDSGELAVAGESLGVPHPPGYPIWTILAWIFTKLFAFVPFRGQPNPAWSIGLLSAVFGALAAGMTAMLICRSGHDLLRASRDTMHTASKATEDAICWVGGVAGSLLFAFSPVMWSQSVIVEVYSLNAFFLVLIFLLTYQWMCRPSDKILYITGFVFGLGLTNYQVLLLAALPLVIVIMLRDLKLFRDFVIIGAPFVITLLLVRREFTTSISHPLSVSCFVYMAMNLGVLLLGYFLLPRGRTVALTLLAAEIGIAFYGYMPIVSDLRNPPMNWGYPRTWNGFIHAITRGQYEKISPSDALSVRFVHQIGAYLSDLRGQFTLPIALLGFLPFAIWHVKVNRVRFQAMHAAILLSVAASVMVVVERVLLGSMGGTPASLIYKTLIGGVILIVLAGGAILFAGQAVELTRKLSGKEPATLSERIMVGLILLGAATLFLAYVAGLLSKVADVTAPLRDASTNLTGEQVGTILTQCAALLLLIAAPPLIIGIAVTLMRNREYDLNLTIDPVSRQWVIATLFGFLAMSIMLIVLANPKGDIQDNFIQRVKFISSHALYAFWIGYGLIFGLAAVDTLFRGNRTVRLLGLGTALVFTLIPIHQNAYNRELIRLSGGAEQSGHDFGWQFGNYQLRGAEAILEELAPDEEPLPNPAYPPAMGPDAIFYGGTDPGRFVPTYMIYGARVREDVFLITQNALADNTYMSVMRDLYGDQIWIPSQPDSAMAFQRYVSEVKSGKRQRNAALNIENGRVQVSGALGVMEINGILAEMIFEHNKYRHDFYVEESYIIHWMYPYLTPHGLIMKINANKTPLAPDVIRDDQDFWDWYARRLVGNRAFRRDVVARKSFSKLRSAIGGLYANRLQLDDAEQAFQQARLLYKLSPEASFRLAQEVYLRRGQFAQAETVMRELANEDPGNDRVPDFIRHIQGLRTLGDRIRELESRGPLGNLDVRSALELADLYRQANREQLFTALLHSLVGNTNVTAPFVYRAATMLHQAKQFGQMDAAIQACLERLPESTPPGIFIQMAKMYADAQQPARMRDTLRLYLARQPDDWKAWLDLATLESGLQNSNDAMNALSQALRLGGNEARHIVNNDERFAALRQRKTQQPASGRATLDLVIPEAGSHKPLPRFGPAR